MASGPRFTVQKSGYSDHNLTHLTSLSSVPSFRFGPVFGHDLILAPTSCHNTLPCRLILGSLIPTVPQLSEVASPLAVETVKMFLYLLHRIENEAS